jgi:hypothetical protein
VFALTVQFPWVTDNDVDEAGIPLDPGSALDVSMAATPTELLTERLHNQQFIGSTKHRHLVDVVSWMVAMQAQDYPAAKWAIGLRAPGCHDADIEQAFNDGKILRTHVLRPTWHFVSPQDIRWLLAVSAPRVHAINSYYYRQAGLDEKMFNKSCALMQRLLEGGNALTRQELGVHMKRAKIPSEGLMLAYLTIHAELEGVICSGPRRGKQFTYALLDERAPTSRAPMPREEALVELVKRYFASHGPATARDFSWWSGFTISDATKAITAAGAILESAKIGDLTYWSADRPAGRSKSPVAFLLPNYDEYLIAFKDRGALVDGGRTANLVARSGGAFAHHLIVDGRLAGSWSRTISPNSVKIDIAPYKKLTPAQLRAVANAADCYGEFLGLRASLSVA